MMAEAIPPSSTTASAAADTTTKSKSKATTNTQQRPIHPAVLTNFGPGKGSGSSELSVWAYLTRPRPPPPSAQSTCNDGNDVGNNSGSIGTSESSPSPSPPLPNLVTAQSNSLRVYTVLPNAGTLALTAVYDNLAGSICSLDVIPYGTASSDDYSSGNVDSQGGSNGDEDSGLAAVGDDDDGLYEIFASDNNNMGNSNNKNRRINQYFDGILLGFAGHPRLSLVYPSTPMVGGGVNSGVGQGGVLLASSIIDLTPALIEKSVGGTSYLEQDMIVAVSNNREGNGVAADDGDDPSVSVVLGGGVAIASFSLPKGPRPDEANDATKGNHSWWRVASEPYILPLPALAAKIRDLGGSTHNSFSPAASQNSGGRKNNQPSGTATQPAVGGLLPTLSHGFGDVVDIAFLSGYTEPTLLILHTNPRRGGGRVWPGRLGRTAEVPLNPATTETTTKTAVKDDYGEEMEIEEEETKQIETSSTGTKHGLTLTSISLSVSQRRSVVLWSLGDALPIDSWKLVPHPTDGVLVWGVNVVVYVSMGGKVRCALATNGFAKIGCPSGLIPPPLSQGGTNGGGAVASSAVHLEPNPSPLPPLALQLDGSRVAFVTKDVALVCLGNGSLHSLEMHHRYSYNKKMFMSLFPLGHKVGGLGVASCLSALSGGCHFESVGRFLAEDNDETNGVITKKEEHAQSVMSKDGKPSLEGPKIQSRGLVFIGSRMGDCTLLAFSMNEPTRLVITDVDAEDDKSGVKRKPKDRAKVQPKPDTSISMSAYEPARKQPKLEESEGGVDLLDGTVTAIVDDDANNHVGTTASTLTEEEILRLEEEELYRIDNDDVANGTAATPSIVSILDVEEDDNDTNSYLNDDEDSTSKLPSRRRCKARYLSMFRSIRATDSLTGLGPLGGGIYGPVATCPSLTTDQDGATIVSSSSVTSQAQASLFSNAFASAARHFIMPCGFGASGGLAVLTTPGRDSVGGTILCESDLCNMAGGGVFGLPRSGLVFLGRADGGGNVVLRGVVVREEETGDGKEEVGYVEGFEELDIAGPSPKKEEGGDGMDVDDVAVRPSFDVAADVLGKMSLLAVSEFGTSEHCFSVFFVQASHLDGEESHAVVIMSSDSHDGDSKESKSNSIGLRVNYVHRIKQDDDSKSAHYRGKLSSITPMVCEASDDGSTSSVTFGCVWTSGVASVFNISSNLLKQDEDANLPSSPRKFEVSESIFMGDPGEEDVNFYDSNHVVGMDVISLPNHIFDSPNLAAKTKAEEMPSTSNGKVFTPTPDPSSSLSFPPDRLSMHGTWCAKLGSHNGNCDPSTPALSQSQVLIAVCRRSGLLQIYDNENVLVSPIIEYSQSQNQTSPIWQANGCSHGTSILGQSLSSRVNNIRRPELHDVEAAEIRFFVAGPSLQPESIAGKSTTDIGAEKDSWMLRSLCILVDTSHGDLHLYSGSKRTSNENRLEFSRVPLSNVTRPSDEAGRHFVKLRRKRIIPPSSAAQKMDFRPNRLHRFRDISGEDGLFAATPRPLWFVSERGAPTVVSHKSRHVSPAGAKPVPVSGFCTAMPDSFKNAKNGFITIHERIGRVGSQRLTLYNGLWDMFAPHGIIPGGGISIQKVPLGVTVRHIEFIDDASISSISRPVYAMLVSHEIEADQSYLNDDGLTPEERQRIRDEKEAAKVRKQVEADLGGFDIEQEWVEEIEREECFAVDTSLGLAPEMPTRKYEVWLVDASSQWSVLDKYELGEFEHGTALKVLYLTDVVEDSDEIPERNLVIAVGTSLIDHDGEDLASKGRILLFQVKKLKKRALRGRDPPIEMLLTSEKDMALGPVTSLSSLKSEDVYRIVVGAGAEVTVEQWGSGKLTQVGFYHAHMQVQEIVLFKTFFLLSDAYDSLHFLVWRESDKSLTLLAKDYEPTQMFASGLISRGGAMSFVCHDDRQNLSFLQYAPTDAAARGGNKLVCRADFHMGTQTTSLRSHWSQSSLLFNSCTTNSTLAALKQQDTLFGRLDDDQRFAVNFGTTDGSFGAIVPLSEPTYWRLTALQSVMSNALESNCALSHRAWRLFRRSTRRAGCRSNDRKKGVIDGDVVMKFVDLPLPEQEDLASSIGSTVGLVMDNLLELGCAASVV